MTHQQKNKLKALFFTLVFSLNTLAGFACSVGVDMMNITPRHEHGKSNHHENAKGHHEHHNHDKNHNHDNHHYHGGIKSSANSNSTTPNDECCTHEVAKFTLLDKTVAVYIIHLQVPVFLLAFTSTFLSQIIHESVVAVNSRFQFVRRSCFLNDIDLRIAIQSFQI
jgi:hypothetical protein